MKKAKTHGGLEYVRFIDLPRGTGTYKRNADYELWGSKYKHVVIWRAHHGIMLDTKVFIIHHKDEVKWNNTVCSDESGKCPILNCGNLAPMTRREHILEHKPGKMSGKKGLVDTRKRKRRGA